MKTKVLKFGGGVLNGIDRITKVISAIHSYKNTRLFVVLSAFYGVTDKLQDLITNLKTGLDFEKNTTQIEAYCKSFISEESLDKESFLRLENLVTENFNQFRFLLNSSKVNLSDNDECYILSFGERISSIILCEIFKYKGLNFKILYPEEYGFFCSGDCFNAEVDIYKSRESILPKLDLNTNYIMPGFYAVSDTGKINILGRGGSDYSASALAACIRCETMDIWKDVDGFKTADPQFVENTKRIDYLSYDEAAELSYFGATILHHHTVVPLCKLEIPIGIFDINNPHEIKNPATIISNRSESKSNIVKSLTFSNDFAILKLKGTNLGARPGELAKITSLLDNHKVNIKSVLSGQTEINLLLSGRDIDKAFEVFSSMYFETVEHVSIIKDISLVALIGEGLASQNNIGAKIFNTLSFANINISMLSFGASSVAIYFIVSKQDSIKTLQVLHKSVIEQTLSDNFFDIGKNINPDFPEIPLVFENRFFSKNSSNEIYEFPGERLN